MRFPLKRRFINDEQHPFPEGRAAGVVMDALHTSEGEEGMFKGKLLILFGVLSATVELFKTGEILELIESKMLTIPSCAGSRIVPDHGLGSEDQRRSARGADHQPRTRPRHVCGRRVDGHSDRHFAAAWARSSITSYLAPYIIGLEDIHGTVDDDGCHPLSDFEAITTWALWCGVAMMTTASLFAFLSKPKMILKAFSGLFGGRAKEDDDCLKHIELPMAVF